MLRKRYLTLLALLFGSCMSHASVTLSNTRVVYHADKKESNITVRNNTASPFLVQSWVQGKDSQGTKAPFIVTPPLFRMDAGKSNALRIIYNGAPLPQDRESLFWINVKSIPSSSREDINKLQIAVNTRIKLFYRPSNLMDEPTDISKNVQWSVKNNELIVRNNSSYYISFAEVKINNKAWSEIDMLAPKSSITFTLRNTLLKNNATVQWKYINDYGGNSQLITQKIE
ncbi:fimbrial biogenesis chaperone [Enterobacter bugandensis]|uniref:fimbrial biogenesis chaperone n=1 Tax=Enterobacter bugandensis TaxID=881260 RepID=UPI0004B7DDD1|nr:molecular chaperone [Enterobacter bugandensis]MCK6731218.1 molecular chaperone [Enterobacter bugandensis]MCK6811941.1 molecular chaperone [Enterobacter bugandensis]MCK7198800.1 molecular chaperone [Enterobacter bugandensis]MCK7207839.1 molecular chaperone [Enterobacter bugandensis]MDK7612175.1 molecular chaperone [Enterobacter bugandensis]